MNLAQFACACRFLMALLTAALSMPLLSYAAEQNTLDPAQRLVNSRKFSQAVEQLLPYTTQNPKNLQARFLLGIALSEQGQNKEAEAVFSKLTEDFPEVPEPYNNLGALYARQGNLEQARLALEMAIRANPNFAIAHENLGDIYSRLALAQYRKAESLDAVNKPLSVKRATLDEVISIAPQIYVPPKISPSRNTTSVPF